MFKISYIWWVVYTIAIIASLLTLYTSVMKTEQIANFSAAAISNIAIVFCLWSIAIACGVSANLLDREY